MKINGKTFHFKTFGINFFQFQAWSNIINDQTKLSMHAKEICGETEFQTTVSNVRCLCKYTLHASNPTKIRGA